jgi:hypothetical protein
VFEVPLRRAALLIFVLAALGVFLWAAVNMTREYEMAAYTSSLEGEVRKDVFGIGMSGPVFEVKKVL